MIKSQIASQLFGKHLRLTGLKAVFLISFIFKVMQEQEVIINHEQAETSHQVPVKKAADIGFLEHYEIKNWEFSPRLYKILAASAAFNILALVVFAQTNILQSRACDSPWVGRVCQVLDTVYVGSSLLSNDSEFVSKDYEKTEIDDAEVVWINQTGTEPLNYPEGYFAVANPESQFAMTTDGAMLNPGDTMLPGSGFENIPPPATNIPPPAPATVMPPSFGGLPPQRLPKASKNRITIPDSLVSGDNPIGKETDEDKSPKTKGKKPDEDDTAKNEPDAKQPGIGSLPVAEDIINKKPLQDFGDVVLEKVSKKEIDLTKPFSVTMIGSITKDGKFDRTKSAFLKPEGDQAMVDVAKLAIEAIGDSGLLTYLKTLNVDTIKFQLVQDDKQIYAVITSDQKSEQSAKSVSSGLNTAISIGKLTVKEEDTLALLNAAKVESKEKNFVLNFNLDKPLAHEIIKRQLQKAEEKRKKEQESNSTAQTGNTSKTAVK